MKTKWKTAVVLGALLGVLNASAAGAPADEKLIREIQWKEVPLPKGTALSKDGATLLAEHGEAKPVMFSLLSLDNPGIHAKVYALRCSVRYSGVEGASFLETWNSFPGDGADKPDIRAFSRTMGGVGPMSKITGDSDWRPVMLPFNAEGTKGELKKLEFNLFMPGKGRVEIKDVKLVEFPDAPAMWQSLQRSAEVALAPPAVPVPLPPKHEPSALGASGAMTKALLAAMAIAVIAFTLAGWKKRRDAERRRMKALDAM